MTALVVIDTNVVLDLFVYQDPVCRPLGQALYQKVLLWISTKAMRDELERVLAYPQIVKRLESGALTALQVLNDFDGLAQMQVVAVKSPITCKDPDDQRFIDLACAHRALLLSKDKAVLCMKKRLEKLGVTVLRTLP